MQADTNVRATGIPIAEGDGQAPIRVVVAEDAFLVREAVSRLLADAPSVDLIASVADSATLMATVEERDPDVVVTDIRMPPTGTDEGVLAAAELRASHPDVGVVVLSQYAEPAYVLKLLEQGSARRAYLLKERIHHRGQLVDAVRAVYDGGSFIDPKIVELLVRSREQATDSPLASLTPRELETLAEIAQGKSNEAIAESLVLTKRAVEKHINSIFMKLHLAGSRDVSSRVKAALMFLAESETLSPPWQR
jgi:DNA-binding NarL/FixJ family response regulator